MSKATMDRSRRVLAVLLATALVMPGGLLTPPPARAQATGSLGGFMEISAVFFDGASRTFGPGEVVLVTGAIPFIPICPGMFLPPFEGHGEGFTNFFPSADLVVIQDTGQLLQAFDPLVDVSGGKNRVIAISSGEFIDEPVAFTQPAGNLAAGRYDIVMDQCLDGRYDPGIDFVLGEGTGYAFEVVLPGNLPPINIHPLKAGAALYLVALDGTSIPIPGQQPVEIPGLCRLFEQWVNSAAISNLSNLGILTGVVERYCGDLIEHWKGIRDDPPDANFTQFAELGPLDYKFVPVSTPLERATKTLAHALSEQAAASRAFLTSLERFQGAQLAGNDEYMILQLEEVNKFINLLFGPGGSMLRFYAALESFDDALQNDPLGSSLDAQEMQAQFPELRRGIAGLLGPLTNTFIRQKVGGVDVVVPSGLQGWIIVYLGRDPFLPGLGLPGIPQVRAFNGLPPIVFRHPTAASTGPYIAPPVTNVPFDAGGSTDPDGGALTYAWDFDGDGNFDDSSAASAPQAFAEPGTRLAGLKVTDSSGNSDVSYVLVKIGDINTQDVIGYVRSSGDIQHITPNGTVNLLSPGIGPISDLPRALHLDFGGDIFVLDQTMLRHFDSAGGHIETLSLEQVGTLLGFPVQRFTEFVIDGRGDLIVSLVEDLGPGCLQVTGLSQICIAHVPGLEKLVRLARDGSRASVLTDIHKHYFTKQLVNGQLILEVPGGGTFGGDIALSRDPQGNVVVANANNLLPMTSGTMTSGTGIWQVDPNTGAVTNVMPSGQYNFGLPFVVHLPAFGGVAIPGIHHIGTSRGTGGVEVDSRGDYILGDGQVQIGLHLSRMFVPPQISVMTSEINLVEVFPAYFVTSGVPNIAGWPDFVIDRGGDYLFGGGDFFGGGVPTYGLYRVTPIAEMFKVANIATPPQYLDVVPEVREVTPTDITFTTGVQLSNLAAIQTSCPGSVQVEATLTNTGAIPVQEGLRVIFWDGDPAAGGTAIGTAVAPAPIAAGASVSLSAQWSTPPVGAQEVFATLVGANTLAKSLFVCVPAPTPGSSPITLAPDGTTALLGTNQTVTATVVDTFGHPIANVPLTFDVTGANSATGTATTGAGGTTTFTYAGANVGMDTIVASVAGQSSNTISHTWTAPNDNRPPACGAASANPSVLFHADHRLRPIGIEGVTDPDGDVVALIVDRITQDEPVCGRRERGHRKPDATGVGTSTPRVRAERKARGGGRVYEITFTATDGKGGSCTDSVQVGVPWRRDRPAIDSGQRFDSTVLTTCHGRHGDCCDDDCDDEHGDHGDHDDHHPKPAFPARR